MVKRNETKTRKLNIKKPFNGIKNTYQRIKSDVSEWRSLPVTISEKKDQAQKEFLTLQDALILYRSYVATCDYIAVNTDRNIRDLYDWIINEMKGLEAFHSEYIIRLSSLATIRSINERWNNVLVRQKELLTGLEKAPSSFEFYNKMAFYKDKAHKQKKDLVEINQRLSKAFQMHKNAMEYIEKYDLEHKGSASDPSVLSIENAKAFWNEKLSEIHKLENTGADPNQIVSEIDALVRIIYDAPGLAKWINEIEKRFGRLATDHDLLVTSFGRAVIQKEVLDDYATVINNVIPKLWVRGQKEQLNQYLKELENFLNIYETVVEKEIAFAERHSIKREDPATEQEHLLNRLIELTKIFITAMDIRDPLMSNHSMTVVRLAVATSKVMNWDQEEIKYLEIAAMLHDIGKIWIPESILTKKGKLTSEEIGRIRMHPIYGAQILESSGLFEKIIPWIYHHQELWNGSGYPDGLKQEEIPIQSRIISLCEAFDAMLSGTSTKLKLSIEQALDRVRYEAGTFFDPIIAEAFEKAVTTQEMDYLTKYAVK
jgi:putative nucleotidyltransferase with HDIG domain